MDLNWKEVTVAVGWNAGFSCSCTVWHCGIAVAGDCRAVAADFSPSRLQLHIAALSGTVAVLSQLQATTSLPLPARQQADISSSGPGAVPRQSTPLSFNSCSAWYVHCAHSRPAATTKEIHCRSWENDWTTQVRFLNPSFGHPTVTSGSLAWDFPSIHFGFLSFLNP